MHNMDSLEFTGFELGTKGGNGEASLAREIERERRQREKELLIERGQERSTGSRSPENRSPERRDGRRRGVEIARDRERERGREQRRKCQASGARGESFFKNRIWAHQTVYSVCPVHTGQRTVAVR